MKFREFVESHGLARPSLATQIGVSEMTIKNWLDGTHAPSVTHALRIERLTLGAVPCESWGEDFYGEEKDAGQATAEAIQGMAEGMAEVNEIVKPQ